MKCWVYTEQETGQNVAVSYEQNEGYKYYEGSAETGINNIRSFKLHSIPKNLVLKQTHINIQNYIVALIFSA